MDEINKLNKQLEDNFGRFEDRPRYRLVWSTDELEMRYGTFIDYVPGTNIKIREVTELREVPKYKQWAPDVYILERITPYDTVNHEGTMINKIGYEPLHTFNKLGKEAIPSFAACKFLIEIVIEGTKSPGTYIKHKDPDSDPQTALANQQAEIEKIMYELYGNETDVTDALAYGEGVTVPDMGRIY